MKNLLILIAMFFSHSTNAKSGDSYTCNTTQVLTVEKDGKLVQFLPGIFNFTWLDSSIVFGPTGYISNSVLPIEIVDDEIFFSHIEPNTIRFKNGIFHNSITTYEGFSLIQATCKNNGS